MLKAHTFSASVPRAQGMVTKGASVPRIAERHHLHHPFQPNVALLQLLRPPAGRSGTHLAREARLNVAHIPYIGSKTLVKPHAVPAKPGQTSSCASQVWSNPRLCWSHLVKPRAVPVKPGQTPCRAGHTWSNLMLCRLCRSNLVSRWVSCRRF